MAEPVTFEHVNTRWIGQGDIGPLPVCDTGGVKISKWELSAEEIVQVLETGVIWLHVWADVHPAVSVSAEYPFAEVAEPS